MDQRIAVKFFGTKLDDSFRETLITNIQPVYDKFLAEAEVLAESSGFYDCALLRMKGKMFRLIKITPGSIIIDILKIIKERVNEILLLGLVGAISEKSSIGDLVAPRYSQDIKGDKECLFAGETEGRICQLEGMVYSRDFYRALAEKGIDFVDMESYYLSSFGWQNGIRTRMLGLVSDKPLEQAFYEPETGRTQPNLNSLLEKI